MKRINFIFLILLAFFSSHTYGQELLPSDIEIERAYSPHEGLFRVISIKNKSSVVVIVRFTDEYRPGLPTSKNLKPGESRKIDVTCNIVEAKAKDENGGFIVIYSEPKPKASQESNNTDPKPNPNSITSAQATSSNPAKPEIKPNPDPVKQDVVPAQAQTNGPLTTEFIISDFYKYLESVPFLSKSSIEEEASEIDEHINNLRNWKDKKVYIKEHRLKSYADKADDSISIYSKKSVSLIIEYIGKFKGYDIVNEKECTDSIQAIINNRLEQRDANITRLRNEIDDLSSESSSFKWKLDWITIGICAGLFVLITLLFVWFKKINKNNKKTNPTKNESDETSDAASAIVVRRKTTSILRKQSLEDVEGNGAYYKIDCSEFCDNSAVRRIYIKNTCIKEIYNMYAEDLRNPDNPKEDGCMVLGRWVYDTGNQEYYVSLEQIVLPGDDAVFAEYELNFGGKIKLKVTEKLRKLRKDTNLQYDLTCWVHSHPGLGVFFSNSDCNVQAQLKHPTHPNFLTAIVVDILTPQQELGIFTFKRDSTINSKADLKRMYSLEELYKWAVESERNSFKSEDYYNIIANAKARINECYGIELSNGAIIDMDMLVAEQNSDMVGLVHGFCHQIGDKTENVAVAITKNEAVPDNELIGCFIIATHCSIPSLRKIISRYLTKIKFILVYTTTNGMLTSIPVVNHDICSEEQYYGEQKLEDLKIWTRRKR